MNDNLNKLVGDRKSPFNIENELKIRKLIESGTDYMTESGKNKDKYGFDISMYRYDLDNDNTNKIIVGYTEIEQSTSKSVPWNTPNYLKQYSFLCRKVFVFDKNKQEFTNNLKENAIDTIYLKLNYDLTDAFCSDLLTISKFKRKLVYYTGKPYNDWCLRCSIKDNRVIRGVDNCLMFIREYFKYKEYGKPFTPMMYIDSRLKQ